MPRKYTFFIKKQDNRIDFWILFIALMLSIFGIIMIFEASNVSAYRDFHDKYYYIKEQFVSFVIGTVLMLAISKIDYRKLNIFSVPLMVFCMISLMAVFIPGIGVRALGAHRWINLKIMNFQPSELTKLALVIYLSSWLSSKEKGRFLSFLILFAVIVGLVILQPDLGTAIILSAICLVMYFLSGAPVWQFILLLPASAVAVMILAYTSSYRYQRLLTFLNPNNDPLGASYHIRQILISFGSGGFWGLGLGSSIQKYQYLPEATTDSIFAIIGEEFGFLGSLLVILLIIFLLSRIYLVIRSSPDRQSFLLSGGIFSLLAFQTVINLGAMVAVFPLTGTPLPFISYGGSSLIVMLVAVGIMLNISKYDVKRPQI